jgi:hypothetical protein
MDPYTLSRLSIMRQQEILDQAKPTWGYVRPSPSLMARFGCFLIAAGVRLRNLHGEFPPLSDSGTFPVAEQPCESPC